MKQLTLGIATTMLLTASAPALAGAGCDIPANERCDGAIVFTTDDLPYHVQGILGCANDISDKPYWDVFYRFDCLIDGDYAFDMCESERDTYLRIYVDGCGFRDGREFAVADDECPSQPPNADPLLSITLEAGVTYWIELGTWRPDLPWGAPNLPYFFNVTLEPGPCPGDVDDSGRVDFADLLILLGEWGPCGESCPSDLDDNGTVDFADLLILLAAWGPCP